MWIFCVGHLNSDTRAMLISFITSLWKRYIPLYLVNPTPTSHDSLNNCSVCARVCVLHCKHWNVAIHISGIKKKQVGTVAKKRYISAYFTATPPSDACRLSTRHLSFYVTAKPKSGLPWALPRVMWGMKYSLSTDRQAQGSSTFHLRWNMLKE